MIKKKNNHHGADPIDLNYYHMSSAASTTRCVTNHKWTIEIFSYEGVEVHKLH